VSCVTTRDARLDTCKFGGSNKRARARARARALCAVYTVHNNEEFAQTGIATFFKQREQGQTILYGRIDKHDVRVLVFARSFVRRPLARPLARSLVRSLTRSLVRSRCRIGANLTRTRDAECLYRYERASPLYSSRRRLCGNYRPSPSTSIISDMLANICRAKHTNTIQCCLLGRQWCSVA